MSREAHVTPRIPHSALRAVADRTPRIIRQFLTRKPKQLTHRNPAFHRVENYACGSHSLISAAENNHLLPLAIVENLLII